MSDLQQSTTNSNSGFPLNNIALYMKLVFVQVIKIKESKCYPAISNGIMDFLEESYGM